MEPWTAWRSFGASAQFRALIPDLGHLKLGHDPGARCSVLGAQFAIDGAIVYVYPEVIRPDGVRGIVDVDAGERWQLMPLARFFRCLVARGSR